MRAATLTCIPPHMRDHIFSPREEHLSTELRYDRPFVGFVNLPSCSSAPSTEYRQGSGGDTYASILNTLPLTDNPPPYSDLEKGAPYPIPTTSLTSSSSRRPNLRRRFTSFLHGITLGILLLLILHLPSFSSFFFLRAPSVPPLSVDFLSTCNSLLTPTSTTYTDRLDRLASALTSARVPGPAVAWIAEPGASVSYFLGSFSKLDWWLSERPFLVAITASTASTQSHEQAVNHPAYNITILTPAFEAARAHLIPIPTEVNAHVTWLEWAESDDPYATLLDHIAPVTGAIVIDPQVRFMVLAGLQGYVGLRAQGQGQRKVEVMSTGPVSEAVALIRERKDPREVGLLRCANQMTVHAIRKTRSHMYIGITESATANILAQQMAATGLEDSEALVLFGENAALPHGSGTDRVLGVNDFALIDAGGLWGGYRADVTRTFALPESQIPHAHKVIWETVRRAQIAPSQLLKSTPLLADLDVEARRVISSGLSDGLGFPVSDAAGPDYSVFTHRLGHGIGLEGHESPYVVQGPLGSRPVKSGYVVSQEPGVYIPAEKELVGVSGVGVRLEDCLVMVENDDGELGFDWLSGPVKAWGDV